MWFKYIENDLLIELADNDNDAIKRLRNDDKYLEVDESEVFKKDTDDEIKKDDDVKVKKSKKKKE